MQESLLTEREETHKPFTTIFLLLFFIRERVVQSGGSFCVLSNKMKLQRQSEREIKISIMKKKRNNVPLL